MKGFKKNQRIVFTDPTDVHLPLLGKTGTVTRLLIRSDEAWVNMDENIPSEIARFPDGDNRRNHVCCWPWECEDSH